MSEQRLYSAACERNQEPILAVLSRVFAQTKKVLEVASGTGMHAAYFSKALTQLSWLPSDRDGSAFGSIEAWSKALGVDRMPAPAVVDVLDAKWWEQDTLSGVDGIFCANMIHIAPWSCCQGLMEGAGRLLEAGGKMVLYGPFLREGVPTAPSNLGFDRSLRQRDPSWGIRALKTVSELALSHGLTQSAIIELPANNLCVVFERKG